MTSPLPDLLTRSVAEILPGAQTLAARMQERPIRVYLGIDPTGSLLTLGHSVALRKLQAFADAGHEAILLIGSGTVRIGDPTGRDSTRPELTDDQIRENFKNWQAQASKILDFSKIQIKYNGDWLDKLNYADMVKLMAQTTVQQLLERDMFQDRLKKGLPIHGHEIMYPLLQGYDSVAMDVDLEIGGTDQTFNMMMGRHLQRVYHNHDKWVLTTPIINGTDGRKMSKSYGNFIALTEEPDSMYGKLMSVADELILEYFTLLTDVSLEEIKQMKTAMQAGENPMRFKKRLAHTITAHYHTSQAADDAQGQFERTVQGKEVPEELQMVTVDQSEILLLELLHRCAPDESKNNLRRLVEQGGVEFIEQHEKPRDPMQLITLSVPCTLRIGKRRFYRINAAEKP